MTFIEDQFVDSGQTIDLRTNRLVHHNRAHIIDGDRCVRTIVFVVLHNAGKVAGQILEQIRHIVRIVDGLFNGVA